MLENGGSGYFPLRVVEPLMEAGQLYRVRHAPSMQRPFYVVYTAQPKDHTVLQHGLEELRRIAVDAATG